MAEEKRDVLVLLVQDMWEVCGSLAALCIKYVEKHPCIVLLNKDTASRLALTTGDTLYVYPPW